MKSQYMLQEPRENVQKMLAAKWTVQATKKATKFIKAIKQKTAEQSRGQEHAVYRGKQQFTS
jgi:hypothetical protein